MTLSPAPTSGCSFASLALSAFLLAAAALPAAASASTLASADHLLQAGHVDEAINELHALPPGGPMHLLLCRALYSKVQIDDAVHECEAAVAAMPGSSTAVDWMGRAYGRKADLSGPITGLRLASRVHDAFETAVRLDPHNGEAVNDLSEYYIGAPGVVGGGLDLAYALADRSAAALPQNAHRIRALAAQKSGDNAKAEAEFRAAVAVANQPNAWVDLGHFLANRKRWPEAIDALQHAIAADHHPEASYVDAAEILIKHKQRLDLAEQWLRAYIDGNAKTDAAPLALAYTNLATVLAAQGDKNGARLEAGKALTLASNYAPAQKVLHSL
jgi:tetratricopeptide (TPR) repeat protein